MQLIIHLPALQVAQHPSQAKSLGQLEQSSQRGLKIPDACVGPREFSTSKIYLEKTTRVCEEPNKPFLPPRPGAPWISLSKQLGIALIYFPARVSFWREVKLVDTETGRFILWKSLRVFGRTRQEQVHEKLGDFGWTGRRRG